MRQLTDVLKAAQGIYEDLITLQDLAKSAIEEADKRQSVLDARESKIQGIESALVVLDQAKQLTEEAAKARIDLSNDRADFENYKTQERAKISVEAAALNPEREIKEQNRLDKINITEREAALRKEVAEYKDRVRKELVEHFKNTNGKG
jgi:hypothetical protein